MDHVLIVSVFSLVLVSVGSLYAIAAALRRRSRQRQLRSLIEGGPEPLVDQSIIPSGEAGTRRRILAKYVDLARIGPLLLSAGVSVPPERFLALVALLVSLSFLAAFSLTGHVAASLAAMFAAGGLMWLYLVYRRRLRDEELVGQMPNALDMIVRALRVGQSVDNALREVASSCPPPLGTEIQIIYEEMALGLPFVTALSNFEARFARVPDVKLMSTAFIIQRETGGNLTRVLGNLSTLIRERDQLRRQVHAFTAEGRSSALILGVLPVAVGGFFWTIRPEYLHVMFASHVGRKMLLCAALLEICGFLVMRLMIRVNP